MAEEAPRPLGAADDADPWADETQTVTLTSSEGAECEVWIKVAKMMSLAEW